MEERLVLFWRALSAIISGAKEIAILSFKPPLSLSWKGLSITYPLMYCM